MSKKGEETTPIKARIKKPARIRQRKAEAAPKDPFWLQLQKEDRESEAAHLALHRDKMSAIYSERSLALAEAAAKQIEDGDPCLRAIVVEHANGYPVKSLHSGRWTFTTHRVMVGRTCRYNTRKHLPDLNGTQDALTADAEALILEQLVSHASCRNAAKADAQLHPESAMQATTARNLGERHGEAMESQCQVAVLAVGPITPLPVTELELIPADAAEVAAWIDEVVPEALQEEARRNPVAFPDPGQTLDASLDAVCTKRQTATRAKPDKDAKRLNKKARGALKEEAGERKTCSVACGAITIGGRHRLTLAALNYLDLCLRLLAAIFCNGMRHCNVSVILDGEKTLAEAVESGLGGKVRGLQIILDWWHLRKKVGEQLSLALNNKEVRKTQWKAMRDILWHGCVDAAIAHLHAIDPIHIKNIKAIESLIVYLEFRRKQIPVYSVRVELGLKVSSQYAEKTCDLLVSRRQKRQGMAWSQEGSFCFAMVRTCIRNCRLHDWLHTGRWSLDFLAA
jgi:hypothetical protein